MQTIKLKYIFKEKYYVKIILLILKVSQILKNTNFFKNLLFLII
jgi:hypothetical protein